MSSHALAPRRIRWPQLSGYLFVAPALLIILCLIAYPFLLALYLNLNNALVGQPMRFVGLWNFAHLLRSNIFPQTLQNALVYTFSAVVLKCVFGMGLALLLNAGIRYPRLFRGSILLPWVIPDSLSGLGWVWMFDPPLQRPKLDAARPRARREGDPLAVQSHLGHGLHRPGESVARAALLRHHLPGGPGLHPGGRVPGRPGGRGGPGTHLHSR